MKRSKLNRDIHRWGSLLVALPVAVIIVTGAILHLFFLPSFAKWKVLVKSDTLWSD